MLPRATIGEISQEWSYMTICIYSDEDEDAPTVWFRIAALDQIRLEIKSLGFIFKTKHALVS